MTYPQILNIPDKIKPIITKLDLFRYFLLEGGRGSGKSQSIARFLLYIAEGYTVRIVCGREIQSSIEESVYTLFVDLIRAYNLNFDVLTTKITHRVTGSTIKFKGFREQGSVNIKGLEGVDILWVDEAQAITKQTLNIIIPTIRKENAKVFWSMNRYLKDDPVYVAFNDRKDCLAIHIDYFENPHCPEALKIEAEECKNRNTDDYLHIWLGQPLPQANNAAFRGVDHIVDYEMPLQSEPDPRYNYVLGVDLAKSIDYTVLTVLNIELKQVVYFERLENENRASWFYQKQKISAISRKYNNALIIPDSTGVGDPIVEDLIRMELNVYFDQTESGKETSGVKFTGVSKENIIEKLKVAIELQAIRIPNIKILVEELTKYEATKLVSGKFRYAAPSGKDDSGADINHDDCVISLALAIWGARDFIYQKYEEPKPITKTDRFWNQVKREVSKNTSIEHEIEEGEEILI